MLIKNKKAAGNEVFSVTMIFLVAVTGLLLFIANLVFFPNITDVRYEEANTITNRVVFALVDSGRLKVTEQEIGASDFNILEKAGLDETFFTGGRYYLYVKISGENYFPNPFEYGSKNVRLIECSSKGSHFSVCDSSEISVLSKDGNKKIKLQIISGVGENANNK